MFNTNVFSREETSSEEISPRLYNLAIGAVLMWGFLLNWWIVVTVPTVALAAIPGWVFLIGYIACCLLGCWMFDHFDAPLISFIGYNLVVVPIGLVLNLFVSHFDSALILRAVQLTGLVTVVMMVAGTAFPGFFQRLTHTLMFALVAMLVIELVSVYVFHYHAGWIDWAIAIIFCGYIGVDWGRANSIPKTVDNAIDSAAALYLDIINLFIRILSILGRRGN